ncbi:MAG: hypothetical protein M5U32_11035 [Myxococcota bacterium]|nr:hypothetical protein [Myxococcota bacterium]
MSAAQTDIDVDEAGDADAVRAYLARLLLELREAEVAAQAARARAQAASDRVRRLRAQARGDSTR